MSDIIKLLPDSIANKIAAGEVVQRPSSVVKELMENAIDAGATEIDVVVKEAGKSSIQVTDNGKGMSFTDARMAFERHATSKISAAEDLFTIRTHGFRGEAMASIAAVAQVDLRTKRKEDELGTHIIVEGAEVKVHEPVGCQDGTRTLVQNLFYNIPARRNFLKSNPVEMKHVIDEFTRVALAYPETGFRFFNNDLETFSLSPGKLAQRITGLFGSQYKEQLTPVEEDTEYLRIRGYIGKPEAARKTRGDQFFFVNNRYIRSNYLNHAVGMAYQELIGADHFPFYVLFIDIDPSRIDINVHPTKTEIKFDDDRTVYSIVQAAVKKSLSEFHLVPSIDFDMDTNLTARFSGEGEGYAGSPVKRVFSDFSKNRPSVENWETLYMKPIESSRIQAVLSGEEGKAPQEMFRDSLQKEEKNTFQVHNSYIIAQIKSGIMIIDQSLAHERILYERYLSVLDKKFVVSQQFLFPQTIDLSASDFKLIEEMEAEIKALGFVFNVFGKNTIVINGIPADIGAGSEKDIFEGFLEQFKNNRSNLKLDKRENLARSLAKKTAIRHGGRLSTQEMNSIIDQLFATGTPQYSPGGELTLWTITLEHMARYFNKS